MNGFGEAVKVWGGWLVGGVTTVINVRKFSLERKKTREEEIDARIVAVVNPELLHTTLSTLLEGQKTANAKLDTLTGEFADLRADVSHLEGITEARNSSETYLKSSDPKLQIQRR